MVIALLLLMVILVFAWKGMSEPFFGLLALITVFEVQPGELYPVLAPLHLERTLAAVVLIAFLAKGGRFRFPPITKWFLSFFGAMILAVPLAYWPSNSAWACVSFASIVYYHLMLVATLKTESEVRKVILLLIALTTWLGLSADWAYHQGLRQFEMGIDRAEGLTSSGGDPNTLANTMILTMPLMWMMMWKPNGKWTRLFAAICFAAGLYTVIITGSRTAFMGFLLMMVLLVFRRKANIKFLPLLVLSLPLLWIVIPQEYKTRYESVKTRDEDQSYTDRLLSWQGGMRMFLHNPLTGVGPENYTDANGELYWPETPKVYLNAHSLYFKLLGELGSLGVVTFVGYLLMLMALNRRLTKRFREEHADALLQNFPGYCNLILYLLLFTGYSGHNLYRPTWFTMGAISGAMSLMACGKVPQTAGEERRRLAPAWIPQALQSPQSAAQPAKEAAAGKSTEVLSGR